MQFFIFFLSLIFCIINLQIILGDIKRKKIYNKYLFILLILGIISVIHTGAPNGYTGLIGVVLISLCIGFFLYYFSLLGAGDIKYTLILGIFIFPLDYSTFIGNIALISIPGLIITLVKKEKILYVKKEIKKKITSFSIHKLQDKKNIFSLIEFLNSFFILFLLLKIARLYAYDYLDQITPIIIITSIGITMLGIIAGRNMWRYISKKLNYTYGIAQDSLKVIGVFVLFFMLVFLSYQEYLRNKYTLLENLYKMLTFSLLLYVSFRAILFIYRNIYDETEKSFVQSSELQEGDKIDKHYLEKSIENKENISLEKKEQILCLSGALDKDDVLLLQEVFPSEKQDQKIKIYKTTHFSQNIFIGFLLTFFFGDMFTQTLIDYGTHFIVSLGK